MKNSLVIAIRQVEDEFRPFLLPSSDFHWCASAITKMECILSSTYGSLEAFVSFYRTMAARLATSMKTALPFHDGVEISCALTVWRSDAILQTEKLTESSVPLVHCK